MEDYPNTLKEHLVSIIREMSMSSALFVKNPGHDFTRNRKLPFETMIQLLLSMGGNTIYNELLEANDYDLNVATSSAFVQQRDKIKKFALEFIFREFTMSFPALRTYRGFRLLADDGSDLHFATDPTDPDTYFQNKTDSKGFNLLHLNALYDLCNRIYVDALIQPRILANEHKALTDMVTRSQIVDKVILLADRGYECYNNFAYIERKGWKYVIRVKDVDSNGILSGISLPKTREFDVPVHRILTRSASKEVLSHPEIYRFLSYSTNFDFMDNQNKFYPISFRVVRFKISDDTYETLITNLDRSDFSLKELKALYNMRWGIETSFRHLKYSVGLVNFHAKKQVCVRDVVFARLITYYFTDRITAHVIISKTDLRYEYQVNFTIAVRICKHLIRSWNNAPLLNVEALIRKNTLPIRPGRKRIRIIRSKSNVSFIYRVA